jgi:hypothetical protein
MGLRLPVGMGISGVFAGSTISVPTLTAAVGKYVPPKRAVAYIRHHI